MHCQELPGDMDGNQENEDPVLDMAPKELLITAQLTKEGCEKRAATLLVEMGEVHLQRKGKKVKMIYSVKEQKSILQASYS